MQMCMIFFCIPMIIKNVRTEIISYCFRGKEENSKTRYDQQVQPSRDNHQRWHTHIIRTYVYVYKRERERKKKKETPWRSVLLRVCREHYWREEKEKKKKERKERNTGQLWQIISQSGALLMRHAGRNEDRLLLLTVG